MRAWAIVACVCCLSMLASCSFASSVTSQPETTDLYSSYTQASAVFTEPFTTAPELTEPIVTEPSTVPTPSDDNMVKVSDYIEDVVVELKYATEDNFTGQVIYDFTDAYLRYGTVKKLLAVQQELGEMGLYIKIWDGFRPIAAQHKLWQVCPDPTYVANPNVGFSSHSRGNTVDITLVDYGGNEIIMPTGFDDFSPLANRDYSDCSLEAANNAKLLEQLMEKHGFQGYFGEWWHFTDSVSYQVEHEFRP